MDETMPVDVRTAATQFVDLALRYRHNWPTLVMLPNERLDVLFAILSAACLDPGDVVPGRLKGDEYQINAFCPFKVIDLDGRDLPFATGWLDRAVERVVSGANKQRTREDLIDVICFEIERSAPLAPIQLTEENDFLVENFSERGHPDYFIDHTRDDHVLTSSAGIHALCRGFVDRRQTSKTHDVLLCRHCSLRVSFPREIRTYGDLRTFFESKLP